MASTDRFFHLGGTPTAASFNALFAAAADASPTGLSYGQPNVPISFAFVSRAHNSCALLLQATVRHDKWGRLKLATFDK